MATYVFVIILAYLIGSIPSGLIIGKVFYQTDIREHGSKNLGGTNTFRVLGKKAGIVVTLSDLLKGTLATALPFLFGLDIHELLPGLIAIVGHMYPVFARFRGGKAVATSAGVILFAAPLLFAILFVFFFTTLYITKYVSLTSMICSTIAVIYSLITMDLPLIIVSSLFTIFIFYRHTDNIKRIINKTEPKITWL